MRLGNWKGVEQSVDDRTKGLLGTDQVVIREYHNGESATVWLAIVWASENRSAFHPPELCYTGSDFELVEQGSAALQVASWEAQPTVNRLLMTNRRQQLLAYYWFTAGDRLFTNYHRQQLQLVWNQICRRSSSGTLVRMSTPVDDIGVAAAEQRLSEAASLVMSAMHTHTVGLQGQRRGSLEGHSLSEGEGRHSDTSSRPRPGTRSRKSLRSSR